MNTRTDQQLLREFAESRSESAFAELVRRHINLVHSAAMRLVGNPHSAEDVTQDVFAALARDARKVAGHPVLAGWLHRTTRNLSANNIRTEVRRSAREKEAIAMLDSSPETDSTWAGIAPCLDAMLGELSDVDRDAVMLRYFEERSAKEMALLLGISAEAAQKRVNRAVDRLRESFARRGIVVSGAALGFAISAHAVQAAPPALAASISVGSATTPLAAAQLAKYLVPGSIVVLAGVLLFQTREASRLREEFRQLQTPPESRFANYRNQNQQAGPGPERIGGGALVAAAVWDGDWHGVKRDPGFTSFDHPGRPTSAAVEKLELTDEEVSALVEVVGRVREKAIEDFSRRIQTVGTWTDAEGRYHETCDVPSRPDRGRQFFELFSQGFEGVVGRDRANKLMSGLVQDEFLGGMGKLDLEFEFIRDQQGSQTVKIHYRDPKTGRIDRIHESGVDFSFEERFGKVPGLPATR